MIIWRELQTLVYTALLFLDIDVNVFAAVIGLMTIDTIMGIVKTFFVKELKFQFKQLYLGLAVKSLILLIPMSTAFVSIALGYEEYKWILEWIMKAIVISEFISIITNFLSVKQKKKIDNPDLLSIVLNKIKDKLKKMLNL